MQRNELHQASRPQFKLERLQDRLLLSAVLEDGSEIVDEVFIEETPVEEYVEVTERLCGTVVPEGEFEDLMFYTMIDPELGDPIPCEIGEDYIGGETGEEVIICTFGEFGEGGEILVDSEGSVPDEILYMTGGVEEQGGVDLVATAEVGAPEAKAAAAPADAVSSDVLGSGDDLLGGGGSLL